MYLQDKTKLIKKRLKLAHVIISKKFSQNSLKNNEIKQKTYYAFFLQPSLILLSNNLFGCLLLFIEKHTKRTYF